jgi:amidophosphoribosyltransferase
VTAADLHLDDDKLNEECGIFGVFNHPDASALTALGLHALQHRGQEATGAISFDGDDFHIHRALGLVSETLNQTHVIDRLKGKSAIGHNRYATTGEGALRNVQPLYADFDFGGFAIAHNGNLTNAQTVRNALVQAGALFQSTSDTETVIQLMAKAVGTPEKRMTEALKQIRGAYSMIALTDNQLIAVRDPNGVRPLILGELHGAKIVASETCALDIIGANYIRDLEPGEMIIINDKGIISSRPFAAAPSKFCIFEYVYFARPDSVLEQKPVYASRKAIGRELAKESHVNADMVVPVPDSGVPAAMGYAEASGLPFELGIIRNHYVGRTFIQPTDTIRHLGVRLKHNANRAMIAGKRVILVDDSIVRGTTSRKIVDMVRAAGASEVHMRISSPPTAHSCYYGIDTPEQTHLLAHKHNLEEMAKFIGVDSLAFVSLDGLYRALGETERNNKQSQYCDACFSGDYAIELTDQNPMPKSTSKLKILRSRENSKLAEQR